MWVLVWERACWCGEWASLGPASLPAVTLPAVTQAAVTLAATLTGLVSRAVLVGEGW